MKNSVIKMLVISFGEKMLRIVNKTIGIKGLLTTDVILMSAFMLIFFISCGGGGGGGGGTDSSVSSENYEGEWLITRTPDPVTLDSNYSCNIHNESTYLSNITIDGNTATISIPDLATLNGTLNGSQCDYISSFEADGGNVSFEGTLELTSSTEFAGSGTFRYEIEDRYCEWVEDYHGTKEQNTQDCVSVVTGDWEFAWQYRGTTLLTFTGGQLRKSECYLAYDTDNIFSGELINSQWSGENTAQGFSFEGTFSGNPATSFRGTATTIDGVTYTMVGAQGVNQQF